MMVIKLVELEFRSDTVCVSAICCRMQLLDAKEDNYWPMIDRSLTHTGLVMNWILTII